MRLVFFLEKGGNKKPLTSYKFFFVLSSATHLVAEIGVLLGATQIILRAIVHLKLDTRSSCSRWAQQRKFMICAGLQSLHLSCFFLTIFLILLREPSSNSSSCFCCWSECDDWSLSFCVDLEPPQQQLPLKMDPCAAQVETVLDRSIDLCFVAQVETTFEIHVCLLMRRHSRSIDVLLR